MLETTYVEIIDCNSHGGLPPRGAAYIGRAMRGRQRLVRSHLANPFVPRSKFPTSTTAVVVDDDEVLERYRRHLTFELAGCADRLAYWELRALAPNSTLACWCADRPAVRVGDGVLELEPKCHGDVVFTVWTALERIRWQLLVVDRRGRSICWDPAADLVFPRFTDLDAHEAVWSRLYLECFGHPMVWRSR